MEAVSNELSDSFGAIFSMEDVKLISRLQSEWVQKVTDPK